MIGTYTKCVPTVAQTFLVNVKTIFMNIKKAAIAAAMAIGSLGVAVVPQTQPTTATRQQSKRSDALDKQIRPVSMRINNHRRLFDHQIFTTPGLSPKEYGQYLQRNGWQKWNKKSKR